MKRTTRTRKLVYPPLRVEPAPDTNIILAYLPEPTGQCCANHAAIPTHWVHNENPPGWHCEVCHPETLMEGTIDSL